MSAVPRVRPLAILLAAGAVAGVASPALAQRVPNTLSNPIGQRGGAPLANDFAQLDPLGKGAGFDPYVDFGLRSTFNDSGRFNLYAEFSGGASAFINRDRVQGSGSFRSTYRVPVAGRGRARFFTDGTGRATLDLARNRLFLDLGAYASVSNRTLGRGFAFNPQDSEGNLSQIYYGSVSPRFQREIGTLAIFNANYKAAYTSVDNNIGGGGGLSGGTGTSTSGGRGLTLQPLSNTFAQSGAISLSNQPRDGRFAVSLTGQARDEGQKRLDQNFRSYTGTLELRYQVTRPISLVGSAGYEDYRSTQSALRLGVRYLAGVPLLTQDRTDPNIVNSFGIPDAPVTLLGFYRQQGAASGVFTPLPAGPNYVLNGSPFTNDLASPALGIAPHVVYIPGLGSFLQTSPVPLVIGPVIGPNGDFVTDPTRPRQTTYAQSGFVYNAGLRYTPSRRTLLEVRVGQRFRDVTVTGTIRQEFRGGLLITGSATDGIETFSSILTSIVDGRPVSYVATGGIGSGIGGCVNSRAGVPCTNTQSISSGVFRSRIARIGAQLRRGKTDYALSYTYNNRRYLNAGSSVGPDAPLIDPTLASREDVTQRIVFTADHKLSGRETLVGGLYYGNSNLALSRTRSDNYVGADVRYTRRLNRRFESFASLSATQRISSQIGDRLNGSIGAGLRYNF